LHYGQNQIGYYLWLRFTCKFSWIAHGVELAHAGHIVALVTGMVTGMALIYCAGLALGAIFTRYVNGKKIMGTCAAIVAVIGLLIKTCKKVALSYLFEFAK
jgi:uncharacterized membrane protein YedE/YeeE